MKWKIKQRNTELKKNKTGATIKHIRDSILWGCICGIHYG